MFSINQPLFLQETKPLYPNPKFIWEWELNLEYSHRVSVVRAASYSGTLLFIFMKLHYHLCDSKRNVKASEPRRIFSHNLHNALFCVPSFLCGKIS